MRRFGAPAVTLGFLTVGVQTAINASAGMLRMPQRRFLPAVTLGAALWSLVYTTVGFTVVDAWLGDLSWWWAVVAVGVVVAIVLVSRRLEHPPEAGRPLRPWSHRGHRRPHAGTRLGWRPGPAARRGAPGHRSGGGPAHPGTGIRPTGG